MTDTPEIDDAPEPEWAVVEIMGHREHAGLICEVERFGTALLEVREFGIEDKEPYRVHQYGGSSIFSITPCTERYARKACADRWKWTRDGSSMPLLDYDDPDEDDDIDGPTGTADDQDWYGVGTDDIRGAMSPQKRCRECGCTDDNACVDALGQACHWVEPDLCSACAAASPQRPNEDG